VCLLRVHVTSGSIYLLNSWTTAMCQYVGCGFMHLWVCCVRTTPHAWADDVYCCSVYVFCFYFVFMQFFNVWFTHYFYMNDNSIVYTSFTICFVCCFFMWKMVLKEQQQRPVCYSGWWWRKKCINRLLFW
jgi:hypothetical protein